MVYLIALGLYMCTQVLVMMQHAANDPVLLGFLFYINCAAMALCGVSVVLHHLAVRHESKPYLWGALAIFALSAVVCVLTRVTWFMCPIILIIAAVNVPYRKILGFIMVGNLVWVLGVAVSAWLRWIPDDPIIRPSEEGPGRLRYTLGFVSPNHLGQLLVSITLCYYCLYGMRHVFEYMATAALAVYSYLMINSRAAAVAIAVLIAVALARQSLESGLYIHKVLPLTRYMIFLIPIIWLLLSACYQPVGPLKMLNKLSSKRLYFSKMGLDNDGIWPFGHPLDLVSTTESVRTGTPPYVLDNSYVYIAVQFGAVYFLLILSVYAVLYAQFMRFRCYRLVEVLLVVLIYAVFENVLLRVNINPLPLMLFASINMRSAAVKNDSALGQSGYLLE